MQTCHIPPRCHHCNVSFSLLTFIYSFGGLAIVPVKIYDFMTCLLSTSQHQHPPCTVHNASFCTHEPDNKALYVQHTQQTTHSHKPRACANNTDAHPNLGEPKRKRSGDATYLSLLFIEVFCPKTDPHATQYDTNKYKLVKFYKR